jgi:hypothetical protein
MVPLALYAAITKFMGEKILKFPGWRTLHVLSSFHAPIYLEARH